MTWLCGQPCVVCASLPCNAVCTCPLPGPLPSGVLHSVLPYLPPSHSQELVSVVCGALGAVLDMDPLSSLHSSAPLAEQGQDQRPLCSSKDTAQEVGGEVGGEVEGEVGGAGLFCEAWSISTQLLASLQHMLHCVVCWCVLHCVPVCVALCSVLVCVALCSVLVCVALCAGVCCTV